MKNNVIIRGVGGFYDVLTEEDVVIRCTLRGRLRLTESKILVGDRVKLSIIQDQKGIIEEILPRRNELSRPPIANIDQAIIILSATTPKPDFLLLDRLLVLVEATSLQPVICINKADLFNPNCTLQDFIKIYRDIGYDLIVTSTIDKTGIHQLKKILRGKISTFVGPSGVGKSSLLNNIISGLELPVGKVSEKLGRGRHTTRQVELIPLPSGGLVADTPGFSQLALANIIPEMLQEFFPEIWSAAANCKFRGCMHDREPACAVVAQVAQGTISKHRYTSYLGLLTELNSQNNYS